MKFCLQYIFSKVAFLVILLFQLNGQLFGQERFNVRSDIDLNAAVFVGITEIENGYGIVGNGVYTGNQTPLFFTRFDLQGEFIDRKMYFPESGFNLVTYESGMTYLNDFNQNTCIGYKDNGVNPREGFLASFDEEGDTIQIKYYSSPYFPDEGASTIAPVGFCQSTNDDNCIFISSSILNTQSGTGGDFYIQRMTPDGEVLWEYIYATPAQPEYCNALLPTENGGVLGILREVGVSSKFIQLSESGALISLVENELSGETNDLVWSDTPSRFIGVGGAQGQDTFLTGRLFKMDINGEVIRDNILGNGYDAWWGNRFYKVVKSQDNSGYVAGGNKKEFLPDSLQTDSTGTTISQGWLVKVDEEGTVLWDRTYHYINTPNEEHTLNDLKVTSDGGYIFCGESRDLDSDQEFTTGPPQQGWLVKVDEFGCLVEGCHLSDSIPSDTSNTITELKTIKEYFKAGPIPANEFLNIYQSQNAPIGSVYQLIDMNGRVLEEFPAHAKGSTMMVSVSEFSVGSYQLVLWSETQVLQRERILIEK